MDDVRPAWAQRIRAERRARGWSQAQAVAALRAHSDKELPGHDSMLRRWKSWEAGDHVPDSFHRPLIARTFGTVTGAFFPAEGRRDGPPEISAVTGMDTLDIVSRLHTSDVDAAMLDALRHTVDRLCSEYPYVPGAQLLAVGRQWLRKVVDLRTRRLTLSQHREVLVLAGWLALLVGCVEYDVGEGLAADSTRRAALSLGSEADNSEVMGWAHEMRAWAALTEGDHRGVIAASQAGTRIAGAQGVAVQLAAQEAKAWARIGDRRQTEIALDRGRTVLEKLPHPDNLDHHFVVDPGKFDFYAMDCYRMLGEDRLAETYAHEVLRLATDADGTERRPMRAAEARVTLGVVAARQGDLERAASYGRSALGAERQSLPSLLMVSRDLAAVLHQRYGSEREAQDYLAQIRILGRGS